MKLKKLFAAVLLVCSTGAWAQTDVTSTYLTNANFEGDYSSYSKPNTDRDIYQPTGWTITYTNGDSNDLTSLNSGCTQWNQFSGRPQLGTGGNNTYWIRFRWGSSESLTLSQTVTLPAGAYTLSADAFFNGASSGSATISAAGKSANVTGNSTWGEVSINFTLASETSVTISLKLTQGQQIENVAAFDNFKITYTEIVVKDVLSNALAAATKANATINSSDLSTAIATAQAVYDNEGATQEQVNAAAAALNTATELAMSSAGDITNIFLTNASLSSTDGWTLSASAQYHDQGSYQIGGTSNVRFAAPTADENHLSSEYAFGFECRWSTNYTSYYQTTDPVPAGVYTLTYDVENVNNSTTAASYQDLNYVQVGESKYYSSTEWMTAKSAWTTHTIRVTLEEAAPITVSFGYGTASNNIGSDNTPAIYVSHLKLNYSSFLAGAKAAWDDAVTAAEDAKTANPNVVGSELTALDAELAKAEPTTVDGYNTATNGLTTATEALVSAAPAYNALAAVNAMVTAAGTLEYADPAKKPSASVTATSASDASAKVTSQTTALRAYYESNAKAEGVVGAVDYSSAVADANAETNTGWTYSVGIKNGDQPYTNSDGTTASKYLDGGWAASAPCNIDMKRDVVIPAGRYILTVKARGAQALTTYTLSIGGETLDLPHANGGSNGVFGNGWEDATIEFDADGTAQTLEVIAQSTANQQWFSMNDFRLVCLEINYGAYADNDDYDALSDAIAAAEAKTLGFDKDEYAPYNNWEALEALAAAKAIDPDAVLTNLKADVQAATTALTEATWTPNDGDVDAIYNGHFAEANGNNPKGWTRSNDAWGQQITGLEASTGAETSTAWYYNTNGAWEYGKDGVYTMPLAANQTYELSFKYRKNGNDWQNWMKASVVNGENEGLEVAQFSPADNGTNFVEAKAYFTTGAAGNYILSIEQNGNAHLTDVSLVKVALAELALSENEDYAPIDRTYYETVSLTRTVKEGYNTVVLPFDLTAEQVADMFGEGAKVYSFTETSESADNVAIEFNETATISANVPVLVNATAESTVKNINNVVFKSGEAKVEGANVDFVGVYSSAKVEAGDYFIANSKLYKCTKDDVITIKPFRAYIDAPEEASVKFFFGGVEYTDIATALSAIEAAGARSTVFNLAGQRVGKAQKGVYVVGGKKVIIK